MGITKHYLKSKPQCKCTFRLPKAAAPDAQTVHLVGDFNCWQTDALPMKRLKNGDFKVEMHLPSGCSYQYRFLIDNHYWENDWDADDYAPIPEYQIENSVIAL